MVRSRKTLDLPSSCQFFFNPLPVLPRSDISPILSPPKQICLASNSELITPGGEVQFIDRMIQESLTPELKERVLWFTSMVGKLSSLVEVVQKIKAIGVSN